MPVDPNLCTCCVHCGGDSCLAYGCKIRDIIGRICDAFEEDPSLPR